MLSGPRLLPKSGNSPQQLVVFLHGYGANGADLIDLGEYWSDLLPDAEFISPNAPQRCEVNPMGFQWFGIKDFSPFNIRAGLDQAQPILTNYLTQLLTERQLSPSQLVLIGFSQGTMLALNTLFSISGIRGVIGYSGAFYPPPAQLIAEPHPEVLLIHGDADMVVPYAAFTEALRQLSLFKIQAKSLTCPGLGHGIDTSGLKMGGEFLQQLFQKPSPVIYMH